MTLRNATPPDEVSWEDFSGRGDPDQRFRIYRLCACDACNGTARDKDNPRDNRCPVCRGEGRQRELIATAASPSAVGVALVALGREGTFEECPVGVLDTEGEPGQKWIIRPWLPSPRNVSDAGRVLGSARKR